jgi:hypothetical protein
VKVGEFDPFGNQIERFPVVQKMISHKITRRLSLNCKVKLTGSFSADSDF